MKLAHYIDPPPHGVHGDADFPCQIAIDNLVSRAIGQESHERLELPDMLDQGQVTDVFVSQLFDPERLPSSAEADIAFQKRLRITAVSPKGIEMGRLDPQGRPHNSL
jgi:hypothetical protein